MKIKLTNVGKIQNAEMDLSGLTVIAGENDTGKSTVGKVVFSIIKAINQYEEDLEEDKFRAIEKIVRRIDWQIRRAISSDKDMKEYEKYRMRSRNFLKLVFREEMGPLFQEMRDELDRLAFVSKEEKRNSKKMLNKIFENLTKKSTKKEKIKKALDKYFYANFYAQMNNSVSKDEAQIVLSINQSEILNFKVKDNEVKSLTIDENKLDLILKDATFFVSPLILDMLEVVTRASFPLDTDIEDDARFTIERESLVYCYKDLANKVNLFTRPYQYKNHEGLFLDDNLKKLIKQLEDLLNGQFFFDRKLASFVFQKNKQSDKLRIVNMASGQKTLALIAVLLKLQLLDENHLLIFDEPENHLHPEWQVKLGEIMVKLVKSNIPVLICSHSPYIIESLNYYSQREKIEGKTNFYLAERINRTNYAQIKNVDEFKEGLGVIFDRLAIPLEKLVWEDEE